ncbi:MAG: hypothetical protein DRN03_05780 [Thermoplasmata archaeon]|nr:MAG: hypothetical protein DRN03_05780 [Thermoplasmata archaeon]
MAKGNDYQSLTKGLLFALLLDRLFPSNFWGVGKSVSPRDEPAQYYSDRQYHPTIPYYPSITVTYLICRAIYKLIRYATFPLFEEILEELKKHYDPSIGCYGSIVIKPPLLDTYEVQCKIRHTANALRLKLMFRDIDKTFFNALNYILSKVSSDGGWPAAPDSKESDPYTTAIVLSTLQMIVDNADLLWEEGLPDKTVQRIRIYIRRGVNFLKQFFKEKRFWYFITAKRKGKFIIHTARVLGEFPHLWKYDKDLFKKALNVILSYKKEDGWPEMPGEAPTIEATITVSWSLFNVLRLIDDSTLKDTVKKVAQEGLNTVMDHLLSRLKRGEEVIMYNVEIAFLLELMGALHDIKISPDEALLILNKSDRCFVHIKLGK